MPSGPGVIDDTKIARIAATAPPGVSTFLLTSETIAAGIIQQHRRAQTTTLQLVDAVATDVYALLRTELPAIKIVQVIHVLDESSVEEALAAAHFVDALLLDSGNPRLTVKELGGTGRTHNWRISRNIVEQSGIPVFLAGGLNAENAREALESVGPFGLDICSGVRTDGRLDPAKLEKFMNAVHQ